MPRQPGIWFREQDRHFYTKIRGVQHKLGATEAEARTAFYKLMAKDTPVSARPTERHSVRWLCDKYLDRTKDVKDPETWKVQLHYLKAFGKAFGSRAADSLKAHEVNEWLDRSKWGGSTKALAVQVVKAVFNWAVTEDYMSESPLKRLRRRKVARRERVFTADEKRCLLRASKGCFHDFLTVLFATGMRPFSEASQLTAAMIDWGQKRAVFARHKNAKKGKKRVVYFPPEALAVLTRLAKAYPDGPLLRNARGAAWKRDTVHDRMKRLCDLLGFPHANIYSVRHTYITDALIRGVPVEVVAELVGSSPKIIHAHYAGIDKKADARQAAAIQAVS